MKKRYIPQNSCIFSFSKEKWIFFNDTQTDVNSKISIVIEHPMRFRIISIAILLLSQILLVVFVFAFNILDLEYWWIILDILKYSTVLFSILYIAKGGMLFRWIPEDVKRTGNTPFDQHCITIDNFHEVKRRDS